MLGDLSSMGHPYGFDHHEGEGSGFIKNLGAMSTHSSSSLGSPSSANSSDHFMFQASSHQHEEAHSLITFRGCGGGGGYDTFFNSSIGSLLSFQQSERALDPVASSDNRDEDYSTSWENNLNYNNYDWNHHEMNPKCVVAAAADPRLIEDLNCFQTASNYNSITNNSSKENHAADWLFSQAAIVADTDIQEPATQDTNKRPYMGESVQALKKPCNNATKKPKPKSASSSPSKDSQSIAAKNRRERISERLKTLQELVPNGSKVDLVTMLEKAISYVKFLQLQVKVLATDEFWPAQGGKAPDISQVKEAIDVILSSQKDRNSSSSPK